MFDVAVVSISLIAAMPGLLRQGPFLLKFFFILIDIFLSSRFFDFISASLNTVFLALCIRRHDDNATPDGPVRDAVDDKMI